MARQLDEVETVLRQMLAEHQKLLAQLDAQQSAMKTLDLLTMNNAALQQEVIRVRILALESRRKTIAQQLARELRVEGELTLSKLAQLTPSRSSALLQLRDELRSVAESIQNRTQIGARLAGAVLGHLNTVLRLVAGVVNRTGVYTKNGVPRINGRLGMIEAVG